MSKSNSQLSAGQYNANYGNFQSDLYAQIRIEAFGEDIGQNSWLTSDELNRFVQWLNVSQDKTLLDVACGAGGPALRIAATTGCFVVGVDVHEQAVATASSAAGRRELSNRAEFRCVHANRPLPFSDSSFDLITCIDGINHLCDRPAVIGDWARLLKPGGRLLFTDPVTLTGPMTNSEISARSTAGDYLFVPHGYDERVLAQGGLQLLVLEDVTANMAKVAEARHTARASRSDALRAIEGNQAFEGQQEFLAVAARVAREGRLSRFVYVASKLT
jgi:SAM-dependent methyltransferase